MLLVISVLSLEIPDENHLPNGRTVAAGCPARRAQWRPLPGGVDWAHGQVVRQEGGQVLLAAFHGMAGDPNGDPNGEVRGSNDEKRLAKAQQKSRNKRCWAAERLAMCD